MFKSMILCAALFIAATSAGLVETHHVVEPAVAKVGSVVHSSPSAVSHQSFTRVHNKAVVQDVVAPVVKTVHHQHLLPVAHKTVHTPLVHAAPAVYRQEVAPAVYHQQVAQAVYHQEVAPAVYHQEVAPAVYHQEAAPLVHTYASHSAPVYPSAPLFHSDL